MRGCRALRVIFLTIENEIMLFLQKMNNEIAIKMRYTQRHDNLGDSMWQLTNKY